MENKYYTPSIEEFFVGFEYEAQIMSENYKNVEYVKLVYPKDSLIGENISKKLNMEDLRVKYLDASDIEELGFKFFINKYIIPTYEKDCWRLYWFENNMVSIEKFCKEEKEQYFRGWIKNKSELKKVLNMLNIK